MDDSIPELRTSYNLVLASVTGGASIDSSSGGSQATVVMVASDSPFGIFEFDLPAQISVSEDSGQVFIFVLLVSSVCKYCNSLAWTTDNHN